MLYLPCVAVIAQLCSTALAASSTPSSLSSFQSAIVNFSLPIESTVPNPANPLPPAEEISYRVPGWNIEVSFFNYQPPISSYDTSACMQQAIAECLRNFRTWNLPISDVVKVYVANSVRLSLYPSQKMVWREWIGGVKGLEWFLGVYSPVGMLFQIKVIGQGIVGHGAFTSMDSQATNSTAAHPLNVPNRLPPNPYAYSERPGFQVIFKNYQHQISVPDVRNCADHAMHDAYTKSKGPIKTMQSLTYYTFDGVYLIIVPVNNLMWRDLLYTAEAIAAFTEQWDTVALQFDIRVMGKKVGAGFLSDFEGLKGLGLVGALGSETVSA